VADIVTEGKGEVTSKKGNVISKNASEDDPAVVIERDGVSFVFHNSYMCMVPYGVNHIAGRARVDM